MKKYRMLNAIAEALAELTFGPAYRANDGGVEIDVEDERLMLMYDVGPATYVYLDFEGKDKLKVTVSDGAHEEEDEEGEPYVVSEGGFVGDVVFKGPDVRRALVEISLGGSVPKWLVGEIDGWLRTL
jgi:hypothetical protein